MFNYIKNYKFTVICLIGILILSFFKPPHYKSIDGISNLDKIIHCVLYFIFCSVIWLEYLHINMWHIKIRKAIIFTLLLPIFLSGLIELGQEYLTSYRGGEWLDLLSNTIGSIVSASMFYILIHSKILKG